MASESFIARLQEARARELEYGNQLAEAKRYLSEAQARYDSLKNNRQAQVTGAADDARRAVEQNQSQVNSIQSQWMSARNAVAAAEDAAKTGDSAQERFQTELLDQRQKNQAAGNGYYTDHELRQIKEREDDKAESRGIRKDELDERRATREDNNTYRNATLRLQEQQQKWTEEYQATMADVARGQLTLKEAELALTKSFNDRKIAMENIQNELAAASQINTMGVQQRQQDIGLLESGQKNAMGAVGVIMNMIEYMDPGTDFSLDDIMRQAQKLDDWSRDQGLKQVNAIPREVPHSTTRAVAEGRRRVGTSDEDIYLETDQDPDAPAAVTRTTPEERSAARGKITDPERAFEYALADAYQNYAEEKSEGPKTWKGFKQYMVQTGNTTPFTREDYRALKQQSGGKVKPQEVASQIDRSQLSGGAFGIAPGTTPQDREKQQQSAGAYGIAPGTTPEDRAAQQAPPVPTAPTPVRAPRALQGQAQPAQPGVEPSVQSQGGGVSGGSDAAQGGGYPTERRLNVDDHDPPAGQPGTTEPVQPAPNEMFPFQGPDDGKMPLGPTAPRNAWLPQVPRAFQTQQPPAQQTGQPINITVNSGPTAAPTQPAVDQGVVDQQKFMDLNQTVKKQTTDQAAVLQAYESAKSTPGADLPTIRQHVMDNYGFDPEGASNPFNDYLNSQMA